MTGDFNPKQLINFPYIKGVAEFAVRFKKRFYDLEGEDFSIAVDLPQQLEDEIVKAVGNLPRISLIVDDMGRAIPIIPSDPAIEAVRTSLEYGVDLEFIDASISLPKDKLKYKENFHHLVEKIGVIEYSKLLKPYKSEYNDMRESYMAIRLGELLENDRKVLFCCDIRHHQNILDLLENPLEYGLGGLGSTVTCKVKEGDVWKISPEIPFLMFVYENSRDNFDRQEAILKLYENEEINLKLIEVYRFARNLAVSDGQLCPDLYNILAAAKYCIDDDYAYDIFKRCKSYPYSYLESNCRIKSYIDYDLEPLEGQRILEIKKKLKIGAEYRKEEKFSTGAFIRQFKRDEEHFKSEREFANFLRNNYFHLVPTDEYAIEEFLSGLGDGLAIRETVRYQFLDKIFIKKDVMINNTGYVVEFGGGSDSNIFFDSQNYCVGTAATINRSGDYHHSWECFTMLPDTLEEKITHVLGEVNHYDPLNSCSKIALKYSDFIYIFTDHPEKLVNSELDRNRMKIIPLNRIPLKLREKMRSFRVTYRT